MDLFFDLKKCVHLCTVLQFKDVVLIVVSMVATVCKLFLSSTKSTGYLDY